MQAGFSDTGPCFLAGQRCVGDAWLVRTVLNLPASLNPDPAILGQSYSSVLVPGGRNARVNLTTVTVTSPNTCRVPRLANAQDVEHTLRVGCGPENRR